MDFYLVDTGGLEFGKTGTPIETDMRLQTQVAIEESDLILFVTSQKEPFTSDDHQVAELLRKAAGSKKIFLVVSKCDRPLSDAELAQYYSLGMGDPIQISAVHKLGTDLLTDLIIKQLKAQHFVTKDSDVYRAQMDFDETHLKIALVGRPNVGKSSLINALLNKNKLIVSDVPGTTRDSTDSVVKFEGKEYSFIDTAGLRRRGRIERGIEKFSALRSMASIERADVVMLVIDSSEKISHQDQQIANFIIEAGKGLMILANKWDKKLDESMDEETRRSTYLYYLKQRFAFLSWAPVIFTSAHTKKNLTKVFELIEAIHQEQMKRVPTGTLNRFVAQVNQAHKPSGPKQRAPKLKYITQVDVKPPHFVAFVNEARLFHFSYWRYLENRLRESFGFTGTPIKISQKERED